VTDPRTQAYQRHAAQRALVVLSTNPHIRIADPTVRKTIGILAEAGLLRLPPGEKVERAPRRIPADQAQALLIQLRESKWLDREIAEATGLDAKHLMLIRHGKTKTVNPSTYKAIGDLHRKVYNPSRR
jgi:hypothetical protein